MNRVTKLGSSLLALLVLTNGTPAFASQDGDTAIIEKFLAQQAADEGGSEYSGARKIVKGDLTNDGVPDTVVLYTIEGQQGTNNYLQYLAVFARVNGRLQLRAHTSVGGIRWRSIELKSVAQNSIKLNTLDYAENDGVCCPSIKGRTSYVLTGRKLRERKTRA